MKTNSVLERSNQYLCEEASPGSCEMLLSSLIAYFRDMATFVLIIIFGCDWEYTLPYLPRIADGSLRRQIGPRGKHVTSGN